jgi:mRNA interferase RelE/StbE
LSFKIIWNKEALDDLKKLDKPIRLKIFDRVETYLAQDPASLGKALTENLAGLYRYRYGDYRIIYALNLPENTITILEAGHRRNIYKR